MGDDELRLAEPLAALSVTTDLGMGSAPEKAIRACLLATHLARASDLPEVQVRDVYYTTLLQHLGCTAPSEDVTRRYGDDVTMTPYFERTDDTDPREALSLLRIVGRGTGARRLGHVVRAVTTSHDTSTAILRSVCEVGTRMAERLHLGPGVAAGIRDNLETWDGRGSAYGRTGDDIALPARFSALANQAIIFDRLGGPELAAEVVRRRSGRWFDPQIAATFGTVGSAALDHLAGADVWHEVLEAEPTPVRRISPAGLDAAAEVFADLVDLKASFSAGHSRGVAELAAGAGERLGFPGDELDDLRRAGLLHDLGRAAVPDAVWLQRDPLTSTQREQVRLHAYHSERILDRSSALEPLARTAGMHHERMDGSGYHHRASGPEVPVAARVLAAADVFQALTQERPHRPARPGDQAAAVLEEAGASGTLDPECVRAVIEHAGHRPATRRGRWPAGLSDREVDVLRLIARGRSNRQIATELVISPRTAEHHVQHIYAKLGGSTRAAATVFAMEHGLVR